MSQKIEYETAKFPMLLWMVLVAYYVWLGIYGQFDHRSRVVAAAAEPQINSRPIDSCRWMYDKARAYADASDKYRQYNPEGVNGEAVHSRVWVDLYMACRESQK